MSQESEAVEAGLNNVAEAIRVALGTGRDTIGRSVKSALVKESFGERESRIEAESRAPSTRGFEMASVRA